MKSLFIALQVSARLSGAILMVLPLPVKAAVGHGLRADTVAWRVELAAGASTGRFAPLWLTANRSGLSWSDASGGYLRAGATYTRPLRHGFRVEAGADVAAGWGIGAPAVVQQAYADIAWRRLRLSVGSKERWGYPMDKDHRLSSGMMVEGPGARPVPQVRADIADFAPVPLTRGWLSFKGHVAYGIFTDNGWQRGFAAAGELYTANTLYHSKSAAFRIGRADRFPLTVDVGLLTAAQFGGKRMRKRADGSGAMVENMPNRLPDFFYMLMPSQESTLQNVQGNHCGSWNVSIDYHGRLFTARVYMEHYFEDHSQLSMQYGPWRDGQLGLELTLPRCRWVSKLLWEGLATTDQTGPILYDGVGGTFTDLQMSGCDNYYNNGQFLGWQHWGQGMGHPFLPGPQYNADGTNEFKSNRVRAHHVGLLGEPTAELAYRLLLSHVRHWGTYRKPLDRVRRQVSTYAEATYSPRRLPGWSLALGVGIDGGDYLGASTGAMLTLKKTGIWTR